MVLELDMEYSYINQRASIVSSIGYMTTTRAEAVRIDVVTRGTFKFRHGRSEGGRIQASILGHNAVCNFLQARHPKQRHIHYIVQLGSAALK